MIHKHFCCKHDPSQYSRHTTIVKASVVSGWVGNTSLPKQGNAVKADDKTQNDNTI